MGQELPLTGSLTIDIERDLLSSPLALDILFVTLKSAPREAFAALYDSFFHRTSLTEALAKRVPLDPAIVNLSPRTIEIVNDARARGIRIDLESRLPASWIATIRALLFDPRGTSGSQSSGIAVRDRTTGLRGRILDGLGVMRVHHWPKNVLIFLPILLSHRIGEWDLVTRTILGFLGLCFVASSVYVLNDMTDLANDRRHPVKRARPFASGRLSVIAGLWLVPALLAAALAVCAMLPAGYTAILLMYLALNLAYIFYLKRRLLVDVFALAGSYTLRIIAGNAVGPVEHSFWLLAFSLLFFLSLALVKRYVELDTVGEHMKDEKRVLGRGYRHSDLDMLAQLGIASAFCAVLVLALYVEKAAGTGLYTRPHLVGLICPIVLYVIGRIWVLAKRREMPDDPVRFMLRDWRSHLMGLAVLTIMLAASCL